MNNQKPQSFQSSVYSWVLTCFGPEIAADKIERNHRFIEEALELVQACGLPREDAHLLVDYVFDRPLGEKGQEVGGTMVTLAALCSAHGISMDVEGSRELYRICGQEVMEKIRAKQKAKPRNHCYPAAVASKDQPPLGLRPRSIAELELATPGSVFGAVNFDRNRACEIDEACARYILSKKDIPAEWIEELREIQTRTKRRGQ